MAGPLPIPSLTRRIPPTQSLSHFRPVRRDDAQVDHPPVGVGKTTAELQSPTNYTGIYAGWNLDLDGNDSSDNPWHFGNSRQYPALQYASLDPAAQRP